MKPKPVIRYILLGLLCLHFGLIIIKSFREYMFIKPLIVRNSNLMMAAEYYTQLCILQADYSFFSPDIAPDLNVVIAIEDTLHNWHDASFRMVNSEIQKRFHTCVLGTQMLPHEVQDVVAKSWAARVYDHHPEAMRIRVTIFQAKLPPMKEYATGVRTTPEKIMEIEFETSQQGAYPG